MVRGLAVSFLVLLASGALAQTPGFDPGAPCGDELRAADDTDKLMIAAWVHGRRAAEGPVDLDAAMGLLNDLFTDCLQDQSQSLAALMGDQAAPAPTSQPATPAATGTEAEARALLQQFMEPGADRVALTAALKPSPEDIAEVYAEPLAGKLVVSYEQTFTPGIQIGPKPGQNALWIAYGTTAALKSGAPIKAKFPSAYDQVLQYFRGDHPIVRFKFVEGDANYGLSFDGLIFVNGRWVLMPKPWRVLE
ncbi:MAG: hypothetical protein KDK24_07505 [Pseudooceanicola sp.]|nr:hypothetical protein [Pseudooceanicola sp.]